MRNVFVGVDVSMSSLDICLTLDGLSYDTFNIFNSEKSILAFFEYLQKTYKKSNFYFGYEATSNYMHVLQKLCSEHNINQIMINPYMMSHYLKHLNSRKKSDILDSLGITKYIFSLDTKDFKTVFNQDEKTFKKYNSAINLLRKLDTQLKNFTHSQKDNPIVFMDTLILALSHKIHETKKELEKEAQKILMELYPHIIELKNEIKGVGYSLLLELIPLFLKSESYTLKQLQSFVGLSPRVFESGSSIKKRETMSKRGSPLVRKLLYMSAMVSIRHNEIIREKYLRMVATGKNKKVCLVACMAHIFRAVYIKFNQGLSNAS